jgi:hypothetical protein
MERTGLKKRARVIMAGRMWRVEVGPARQPALGATRMPNRRWQGSECRQQVPINREVLLLFRRVLPGRGVQRKLPSTITNGQKLVLSPRLRK